MASLFKKTFAVVLALAMVFTCLTANAANEAPSISASTSYVDYDKGTTVSLKVSTDNFDVIYGSDFTLTIPEGYRFVSIESDKWVKDSNFVVNGNTIRFLDVRTNAGFDFTLNLNMTESAEVLSDVGLAANMFVDAYEADYTGVVLNNGVISVTNAPVTDGTTNGSIEEKPGYFIPYGSVIDATTDEYAAKNSDGTFAGGTTVSYFKLPTEEVGVSTFAVSEVEEYNEYPSTIQFGSYAIDTDSKNLGTIVIMGNYTEFRANKDDKYADDQAFNDYIMKLCDEYLINENAGKKLKIFYGDDGSKSVRIGRVKRTTYTWKGTEGAVAGHRQYALRVVNIVKGTCYSAIGYSEVDGKYTYSANVQSKLYE